MKHIITAAIFAASLTAQEPDWGKVIDQSRNPHHPHHYHHEDCPVSPVPEPGAYILVGLGLVGVAWYRRRK